FCNRGGNGPSCCRPAHPTASVELHPGRGDGDFCWFAFPRSLGRVSITAYGSFRRRSFRWPVQTDVHCLPQLCTERRHGPLARPFANRRPHRRSRFFWRSAILPCHQLCYVGPRRLLPKNCYGTVNLFHQRRALFLEHVGRRFRLCHHPFRRLPPSPTPLRICFCFP